MNLQARQELYVSEIEHYFRARLVDGYDEASAALWNRDYSSEEAFRTFFGLVVRDVQIRLLLGDDLELSQDDIDRDARRATEQFLTLYERR